MLIIFLTLNQNWGREAKLLQHASRFLQIVHFEHVMPPDGRIDRMFKRERKGKRRLISEQDRRGGKSI